MKKNENNSFIFRQDVIISIQGDFATNVGSVKRFRNPFDGTFLFAKWRVE